MAIVHGPRTDKITKNGTIETTVTLHADGSCFINAYLKNKEWRHGMRGRVVVVCLDDQGRAHWVSQVYEFPTMCGTLDPTCKSEKREVINDKFPEVVGNLTRSLDVHCWEGESGVEWHRRLIRQLQNAKNVYEEVKPYLDELAALSGGVH